MNSFYRHILKQALSITWQHKWLWVFGLLALVLGNGGVFNMMINNVRSIEQQGALLTDIQTSIIQSGVGSMFRSLAEVLSNLDAQSLVVLIFILLVSALLFWISVVSLGGLTSGIFRALRKQVGSSSWVNVKENFLRGLSKFWPVFWINIGGRLFVLGLLVLLSLPFFFLYVSTQNILWQWIILIISFMVLIPVSIIVAFLLIYATIFVVIKNSGVKMALQESWALFKKNWIVSIETALILFIINAIVALLYLVGISFAMVPFFILGGLAIYLQLNSLLWFSGILGGIIIVLALFTVGAMWATYQTAVWVLLFNRIHEGSVLPKILRLAMDISRRFATTPKSKSSTAE